MTYGLVDERTPLTKTAPPDYVYMTNPNRLYRKQVHQFQCCICFAVLTIFTVALIITVLYSVDNDTADLPPVTPVDNASLQLLLGQSWPLPDDGIPEWQLDPPTPEDLEKAIAAGQNSLAARDSLESSNPSIPVNSPSYRHQVSIKTSKRATNLARSAYVMEVATKKFVLSKSKSKNYNKTVGRGPILSLNSLPTADCGAGPLPACPPSKYRTIDGSCNNPYKPNKWGVAMRPYRRQVASNYADGVSQPRVASDGSPLPSARDVSVTVHRPAYRDDPKFTVMFAVWGQFMDHDITGFALSLGEGGKPISCCQNNSSPMHPECFPVMLSKEDPYYSQFGISCMEFVRSAPAPMCALGPREQINQVSSYLDGSVVYGNTPELSRALRSYQGGQLKMLQTADGRTLLPISTNLEDGCNRESENAKGKYCFMAGDARANENTYITSLHLLMARQHNLIASQLSDVNPDWNDEKLYQETRKIVGAQMQHITYNEFLPVLLGPDMMDKLDLNPQENGYYKDYDPSVDASISNGFSASAFRFAHTLLPALMKTVAKDWSSEESVEMHKMLFDPFKLYTPGALDQYVQGAISTQLERADSYFNTQVTQHLFQATGDDEKPSTPPYGLDLVSLNVQRGRDHGLPAYPVWREFCGLTKPKTFDDMEGMVDAGSLARMKTLYKSVDDIDMYTGALSEFPIEGGMVGPTITCLVSDQFKRLKQGDSFFYETDKTPQAFTLGQLDEIKKSSLAGIICSTSDEVMSVQPEVMKSKSPTNIKVPCSQIPQPDFTKWVESTKTSGVVKKSSRIGITVTGGSITTKSGEMLWDGSIPVSVPVPLFSVKQSIPLSTGFGHGVQWKGSFSLTATGLDISGTFSSPIFSHGPIPLGTNYTVKWVNGEFKLNAAVISNDTDISKLVLTNSYESPIYFSVAKFDVMHSKKQFMLTAGEDSPSVIGVEKLPVILIGNYSPDKTSFYWSGNATLSVPNPAAMPTALTVTDPPTTTSGVFNVVGGNLKLDSSDGSSTTLWSGQLPVAISLPLPYKVLETPGTGEKLPIFGNGLLWSASISGSLLEGSFNFPQYNRTMGIVSINWLSGQFSFQVIPLMNISLDELLVPGVQYTSRIIFRLEPEASNLQLEILFDNDLDAPNSLENLIVESQEVIDGTIPAPLILHGTFSPDKTVFYFNGKVILAVKPSSTKITQQLQSLKSPELMFPGWGNLKFAGSVNSGHITAGLNGSSPSTVWTGTVPVEIQLPTFFSPIFDSLGGKSFLFGNGIVWSATLSGTTIKGMYSLPQTVWSMSGIKQQSWEGEFLFEISPLWNSSLDMLFVPGAKYYSKIHFQGAKYEAGLSTLKGVPGQDPSVTLSAPIILQGSHSLDKKTFYWSGSFIVAFQNKPTLMFTIPKKPVKKDDPKKPKSNIFLDIKSGSIIAGYTGENPEQVWSGSLPATISFSSLISSADTWQTVPSTSVIWSGEVKDQTFQGIFTVPTYFNNGSIEVMRWWAGNFSFKYTTQYGKLLEDYLKPGKKYTFNLVMDSFQKKSSYIDTEVGSTKNDLLQLTKEADEVINNAKPGKLVVLGNYYSKPFYCYILPLCSEKKEFYWSGSAILTFPDPPKNKSGNELLNSGISGGTTGSLSAQFIGQVVSGNVDGGIKGGSSNVWWTGDLPVRIPTAIFWTNKTAVSLGLVRGHSVEWSGVLVGNTLKGSFSFPQLVSNIPVPSVQWWTGQFVFDLQPLWNTSFDGKIQAETTYSSGIYFQGMKTADKQNDVSNENFVLGVDDNSVKKLAPIILQGTLSPDGSNFLWSGKFIMSFKNYPINEALSSAKAELKDGTDKPVKPKKPITPSKPVKPKTTVSFTVITGKMSASNGSNPVDIWGGQIPVDINKSMFNPTNTPGATSSITWSANTISPQLSGTFEVTIYLRNESVLLPVTWSGNFTLHYLIKWSGSFDALVKPGQQFTCNLIFKDMVKNVKEPGYIADSVPKQFVLGDNSGTPCTVLLNGKSFSAGGDAFYCKLVPFMCSGKEPINWFSFNGDAMFILKPPENSFQQSSLTKPTPSPQGVGIRRINTTVVSGSIVAGPESGLPRTLWSGGFPMEIPLPVFWNSEDTSNKLIPPEDIAHAHGVIWSGYQMGPRVEGSFSLPQYTKTGVNWWTGKFNFLFQTSWGVLGDLDELIKPGIYYNSRIVFRDMHSSTPLLGPSQIDIDTSTSMPIILLGTYSLDKTIFYWSGNVIVGIRGGPWTILNQPPSMEVVPPSSYLPLKPKQRVGMLISSGIISNSTDGSLPIWSGHIPVTIPLATFNISEGMNVIWTAATLTPKFTGNFSIPQYEKNSDGLKIKWVEGTFSFDLTTLWNTSIDVIEVGKQYATVISSSASKLPTKKDDKFSSFTSLIMEFAETSDSQTSSLNLKGILSPDKLFFIWQGEAWFYGSTNKTKNTKQPLQMNLGKSSKPFGGTVYDGYVTAKKSGFFSFSHTVWSGTLPATISFSSFWSGFISGATFTKGVTWTASSVSDDVLMGSYSVPQYTWDGLTTSVTWYTGDFKFYVRPIWNATLTSMIIPGTQYYSSIQFQGDKATITGTKGPVDSPGISASIILQGSYSPDRTSFFWSGNFILDVKVKPTVL